MKKSKIIVPLALSMLLAGCNPGGSSSVSSSSSSSAASSSSSVVSSSSSSSSVEDVEKDIALTDLKTISDKATEKFSSVASGTIKFTYSSAHEDSESNNTFEYGSDKNGPAAHYHTKSEYEEYDTYMLTKEDGELLTVTKDSEGEYDKSYDQYESIGYPFENYVGYVGPLAYGTEGLLAELVKIAGSESNVQKDFKGKQKGKDVSASFSYFGEDDSMSFYEVSITLKLDDSGAIKSGTFETKIYSGSNFTVDDETGKASAVEGATPNDTYKWEIAQTVGTRTYTSAIDLTMFTFTSFDLHDADGNVVDDTHGVTFSTADYDFSLELANVLPETASATFDEITVSVLEGDEDSFSGEYESYFNSISLSAEEPGTYKVKVATAKVSKTFTATVTAPEPTEISLLYYTQNADGYYDNNYLDDDNLPKGEIATINAYVGATYSFESRVLPYMVEQEVTVAVDKDESTYTLEDKSVYLSEWEEEDDEETKVKVFTPKVAGDYTLTFASSVKPTITHKVKLSVTEPNFKDILSKKYAIRSGNTGPVAYTFDFDPSDDGLSGSVTIVNKEEDETATADYALEKDEVYGNYEFIFSNKDGDDEIFEDEIDSLVINPSYKLCYKLFDDDEYTVLKERTTEFLLAQKWQGTSGKYTFYITLSIYGTTHNCYGRLYDGEDVSLSLNCDWSFTEKDGGGYTLTLTEAKSYPENEILPSLPFNLDVNADVDTVTTSFAYSGETLNFTMKYADQSRGA